MGIRTVTILIFVIIFLMVPILFFLPVSVRFSVGEVPPGTCNLVFNNTMLNYTMYVEYWNGSLIYRGRGWYLVATGARNFAMGWLELEYSNGTRRSVEIAGAEKDRAFLITGYYQQLIYTLDVACDIYLQYLRGQLPPPYEVKRESGKVVIVTRYSSSGYARYEWSGNVLTRFIYDLKYANGVRLVEELTLLEQKPYDQKLYEAVLQKLGR